MTASGARLVKQLEDAIGRAEQQISRYRKVILASPFGPSLRRHVVELRHARETYGPLNLKQV